MKETDNRIYSLIDKMTIEEKVSQLTNSAAAVNRLGIDPSKSRQSKHIIKRGFVYELSDTA